MPRLQLLPHKSYHPYNEKNKQRVREDEAKARAEELEREQKAIDAVGTHLGGFLLTQQESEARLNVLRRRAGSPQASAPSSSFSGESSLLERHRQEKHREEKKERKQKARLDFDWPSEKKVKVRDSERGHERRERDDEEGSGRQERTIDFQTAGHLNFWADLESGKGAPVPAPPTAADLERRKAEQEADKFTVYLSRPDRETKPWYSDRDLKRVEDKETGERAEARRARNKWDRHDPLTSINRALATKQPPPTASTRPSRPSGGQSERERALALLAKRDAAAGRPSRAGWETPDASWSDDFERRQGNASQRFSAGGTGVSACGVDLSTRRIGDESGDEVWIKQHSMPAINETGRPPVRYSHGRVPVSDDRSASQLAMNEEQSGMLEPDYEGHWVTCVCKVLSITRTQCLGTG
ncbi:uncharacterized protein EHS24_005667 [Apiotrichum porosum]|uniref:CBF1-interacting co-repressor CIR N-terminal domain-containing protein n=1 Tax=Apiotrichum porosum TaxID=105984 RepID=A0A427XZC4_9TREE|nr:uncharacterized protein EHS24_005667 [Apiotrichum porosum]RSH84162.1 hypothetical protein EHS24_005667 [Apiotrichum porosum]